MSEDLVARLRDAIPWSQNNICKEAADEIERLREGLREMVEEPGQYRCLHGEKVRRLLGEEK